MNSIESVMDVFKSNTYKSIHIIGILYILFNVTSTVMQAGRISVHIVSTNSNICDDESVIQEVDVSTNTLLNHGVE